VRSGRPPGTRIHISWFCFFPNKALSRLGHFDHVDFLDMHIVVMLPIYWLCGQAISIVLNFRLSLFRVKISFEK